MKRRISVSEDVHQALGELARRTGVSSVDRWLKLQSRGFRRRLQWEPRAILENAAAAQEVVLSIDDEDDRNEALYDLGRRLIAEWELPRAVEVARMMGLWRIEGTWLTISAAAAWRRIGKLPEALALLDEARETVRSHQQEWEVWQQAETLSRIGESYRCAGVAATAVDLWREAAQLAIAGQEAGVQSGLDSGSVFAEVVESLATVGHLDEAERFAALLKHQPQREHLQKRLRRLKEHLA